MVNLVQNVTKIASAGVHVAIQVQKGIKMSKAKKLDRKRIVTFSRPTFYF